VRELAPPHWASIDWTRHERDAGILGRRLRYVDYGEGPAVVLVHGLGGCWQWWLETIPSLGRAHRVVAVDLPGFGASEPLPAPGEMSVHVQTLVALLDHLGLERVVLAGHSLGGLIALLFASRHERRLHGVASVCGGGIALGRLRLAAIADAFLIFNQVVRLPGVTRALALRPRLRRALFAPATGDARSLSPALAAEIVPRLSSPGFADAVVSGAQIANLIDAREIGSPALLIWGALDPILPVAGARELARRLPDGRLVVLDGVGHCPMFECPDRFVAALTGFAAGVSTEAGRRTEAEVVRLGTSRGAMP
jgi:pimeloyl-ACP methyl ester carboxylesterase